MDLLMQFLIHSIWMSLFFPVIKEDRYIPVQLHFLSSVSFLVCVMLQVSDRRCIYHLSGILMGFRRHSSFHCVIHNSPDHL